MAAISTAITDDTENATNEAEPEWVVGFTVGKLTKNINSLKTHEAMKADSRIEGSSRYWQLYVWVPISEEYL